MSSSSSSSFYAWTMDESDAASLSSPSSPSPVWSDEEDDFDQWVSSRVAARPFPPPIPPRRVPPGVRRLLPPPVPAPSRQRHPLHPVCPLYSRHPSQAAKALPCSSAGTDEPRHPSQAATALPCSSAGTDEPRHLSQAVLDTGGTLSSPVPHTRMAAAAPAAHPSKGDGHRRPELQNHRRHPPARLDL